ncbi:SDR family oxidoreductase [Chengkuizengella sediminis]|uniref:SDR family oxidoreductase n=1 Tax=Chengkuizengella sediminis TaxID=1885917 RepID=UPI00138946DF|nr:SDR family oxidoreductase [Chengkuizengella sediminis]NDI35991.1 SDR family oxidoreductase [Chengkuizengella sediminis]
MDTVLVAGATGYLGRFVVNELSERGYRVKALVRNSDALKYRGNYFEPKVIDKIDEIIEGDITKPETLKEVCNGVNYVFTSVGITKQKDGLTYMDVDYQGNLNLLREAESCNVKKFIYIHVLGDHLDVPVLQAKKRFVQKLKQSPINHLIIKPTGYFSDLTEYLEMAAKGKVYLIGDGKNKMNPIHGSDLAKFCVNNFDKDNVELEVGGPEVLSYKKMANLAFKSADKKEKVVNVPIWVVSPFIRLLKIFNKRYYALALFFCNVMTNDIVAPRYGKIKLETYYRDFMEKRNDTSKS